MSHVSQSTDWTSPAAMAIPSEGYFMLEQVWYGPTYPRTPACHGFSIVAKIKPGTEGEIRAYGKRIEDTIAASRQALASLPYSRSLKGSPRTGRRTRQRSSSSCASTRVRASSNAASTRTYRLPKSRRRRH